MGVEGGRPPKRRRVLDWDNAEYSQQLLKIAYKGTGYSGLAWQPEEGNASDRLPTVEAKLFDALQRTCLIRNRACSNFSRAGRTDKGVHAAGNYVSARLRVPRVSSGRKEAGRKNVPQLDGGDNAGGRDILAVPGASLTDEFAEAPEEVDYARILNGVLPLDIRVIAHKAVATNFDARFHCLYRVYRYVFPTAGLDLERMQAASTRFCGDHDFRNFCKVDAVNVRQFRRRILWVRFVEGAGSAHIAAREPPLATIEIAGVSFLWHQVRAMMAVLFMVGRHQEEPEIIDLLLDVEKTPQKPTYDLADERGLILYDCVYEGVHFDQPAGDGRAAFESARRELELDAAVLDQLAGGPGACQPQPVPATAAAHVPLLERRTELSLADKREAAARKAARREARRREEETGGGGSCGEAAGSARGQLPG